MKHCAKKLLGLAFALALCLAVGGTALAQTPEFAEAPDTLPEQEMLAYEPNVTAEPGMKTVTGDGYTVTIPTTVTVESGTDTSELKITAEMKQWRTLEIDIASNNSWKLAYDDTTAADTPKVDYTLKNTVGGGHTSQGMIWTYDATNHKIAYTTTRLTAVDKAEIPLSVNVTDPSQATMSGTYSDTLAFDFKITKQSVTYTINVYGQNITTKADGRADVESVVASGTTTNESTRTEGTVDESKVKEYTHTETYTLEYGFANGHPDGGNPATTWTRTRPTNDNGEDARCWEDLASLEMTPSTDYAAGIRNVTINLNLVRKWYWLDVNGATDYTDEYANGNQGNKIAGFVNMQVSADNGTNWSSWFWKEPGDDYWGQFPYGIHFKLGFHHVKNGYVYDTGTNGGVKIIANKQQAETAAGVKEGDTTYYVYEGTLTGEPTGKDLYNNVRYCYIPCYKKGLTYMANQGTGGKEDVNGANKPRTNVLYQEGYALESPEQLKIAPPSTDMVFAGWSTKSTYTTGDTLYQVGETVAPSAWENYTDQTDLNKRPQLNGTQDTQKRELYAIWGYKTTIKIAFENQWGSTDKDATGVFKDVKKGGFNNEQTLKTDEIVIPGQTLTLDLNDTAVTAAINTATTAVDSSATKDKIWDLEQEYTITVPKNKAAMLQFEILRKRYLLNVMAVLSTGGYTVETPIDATEAAKYGTFHVKSNGSYQTAGGESKASVYQWLRNYGGSYEVCEVEANTGYQFVEFMIPAGKGLTSAGTSTYIKDTLTGKNSKIGYFGGDGKTYTGDTIYVVFKKDVVTFDYNGGTTGDGATKQVLPYDDTIRFPKVVLTPPNPSVDFVGWSTKQNPNDAEIFKLGGAGNVLPEQTTVSSKVKNWPNPNNKVLYAVWRSTTGPNRAPAKKKVLTVRYHANFDPNEELALDLDPDPLLDDMDDTFGFDPDPLLEDVDDALEGAVKTVSYQPGEDVVLRNCMFKRSGYVFVGWNTEPDGTGRLYRVNGVPITDWAVGDTVDLYAQWKKPDHLKPVVDNEPFVPTDPDTPPEELDPGFGIDPDADPADEEGPADDADAVDDAPAVADEEAAAAPPEELDFGFGIDPDAAVGGPAPFVRW